LFLAGTLLDLLAGATPPSPSEDEEFIDSPAIIRSYNSLGDSPDHAPEGRDRRLPFLLLFVNPGQLDQQGEVDLP